MGRPGRGSLRTLRPRIRRGLRLLFSWRRPGGPCVRFHDLRHTAASLMVMAGASMQSVQAILGHSTIAMTERYAHHSAEHVAREAAKLSFTIQNGLGKLVALDRGG